MFSKVIRNSCLFIRLEQATRGLYIAMRDKLLPAHPKPYPRNSNLISRRGCGGDSTTLSNNMLGKQSLTVVIQEGLALPGSGLQYEMLNEEVHRRHAMFTEIGSTVLTPLVDCKEATNQ